MSEYDGEPVRGLPQNLPQDEHILWQGGPDWRGLLLRVLHARKVMVYFAIIAVWRMISTSAEASIVQGLLAAFWVIIAGGAAIGVLAILAAAMARTTVYTITNKRVVLRFGVAIQKAVNIPFRIIGAVDLKASGARAGDIALRLSGPDRIAYLVMWPHVRPWTFNPAQPSLRALPDAQSVGCVLAEALAKAERARDTAHVSESAEPARTPAPAERPAAASNAALA